MKFEVHRHADFEVFSAKGRLADILTVTKTTLDKTGEMLYNIGDYKTFGG